MIDETHTLLFETSPYGNLDAIAQHDGRSVHFYLNGHEENSFGTRACWVRNLKQAPYVLNEEEMQQGIAPMLPRAYCKSPAPGQLPDSSQLRIVWLEEGNGAAMIEQTSENCLQTLVIIPPWSGVDGFSGYAAECCAESPLCWPMPDNPNLRQRIERADEFWQSFSSSKNLFSQLQQSILQAFNRHWQTEPVQYYSINGDQFPPRGLAHYRLDDCQVLTTIAMSLCPQPMVEMQVDHPARYRRIELAVKLDRQLAEDQLQGITQKLSSLASYPWSNFSWFGHGHTVMLEGVFPGVKQVTLNHDSVIHQAKSVSLPEFRGDQVNLLWLTP